MQQPQPIQEIMPEGVTLRDPEDFASLRQNIFDDVKKAFIKSYPVKMGNIRMEVEDVDYDGPDTFDLTEQNNAILTDKYVSRKLRGTVKLFDNNTGSLLDSKRVSLMRVPYMTDRGTFIHGGNDYSVIMQNRLLPGIYTRRQANGHIETQFNPKPGTGQGFRIGFEPDSAQYRLKAQQANLHLYSLLKDLGVPDEQLETEWGKDILDQNRAKYDSRVLDKAFNKLVRPRDQKGVADRDGKIAAIRKALDGLQVHERVARKNLPNLFDFNKAAEWRAAAVAIELVDDLMAKEASAEQFAPELDPDSVFVDVSHWFAGEEDPELSKSAADFQPDLSDEDIREEFNNVVGKVGPRRASMKSWPSSWLTPNNPLGWLSWYRNYAGGRRGEDDTKNIQRWKSFKARQLPLFKAKPTPRRAFALRNWAIDPMKYLDSDEQRTALSQSMQEYRKQAAIKFADQKSDAEMDASDLVDLAVFLNLELGADIDTTAPPEKLIEEIMEAVYKNSDFKPGAKHEAQEEAAAQGYGVAGPLEPYDPMSLIAKQASAVITGKAQPKTYFVDFDGTLVERHKGTFDPEAFGEVIPSMMKWVEQKIDDGHKVVIFTARAADKKNVPPLKKWLKEHGLGDLEVTNEKTPDADYIVDDRAIAIRPDTGESFHRKLASESQYKACPECGGVMHPHDKNGNKFRGSIMCHACEHTMAGMGWKKEASLDSLFDLVREEVRSWVHGERKVAVRKTKLTETVSEHCPHCDVEFPERGGRRLIDSDTMTYRCGSCKGEFDDVEMTDEEIEKTSWGGEEFRQRLRDSREKRRNLRKAARLSYDHGAVEKNREAARAATQPPKSGQQAEAGNYPKGRFYWNGLQIALENPKGSTRRDWKNEPPKWTNLMEVDYGYVKSTLSEADGDHVDVFCGPDLDSGTVYVIDQYKGDKFDEHKVMIGFKSEKLAKEGYLSCYSPGWKGLGAVTALTVEQFKHWVKNGETAKPLHETDVNKLV